ncbi:MAG: sigma 54-interacting transcriptional regulator [Clostridiales Family XIII bacterium]|nr:sigma 54-interacting transcriptional regulator [Clostridiales Family XIII bacterium]
MLIYGYIERNVTMAEVKKNFAMGTSVGIDAGEIERQLGIARNNASTILNDLVRGGKLKKYSHQRPVRYVPTAIAAMIDGASRKKIERTYNDPFTELIGYGSVLRSQIESAKAALLYPPHGLNTLLVGPTGSGKTRFAHLMHKYVERRFNKPRPFVYFNCADYYSNPELLLSQLFGHVKGAFTGAETDKEGLVAKANGGMLLLDEVHRLSAQSQEMLFQLMDTHRYMKLGETAGTEESRVLIIAATTETPSDCLLKTFLRRIPVIIHFPQLSDINVDSRAEYIKVFAANEANIIQKQICIKNDVLKMLALYSCPGNVGQLESDIKLTCANAFFQGENKEVLTLYTDAIPAHIKTEYVNTIGIRKEQYWYITSLGDITVSAGEAVASEHWSAEDVDVYYHSVQNEFSRSDFNVRELYTLLDARVVDASIKAVNHAAQKLGIPFPDEMQFAMAFHLYKMLQRIEANASPAATPPAAALRDAHACEHRVAQEMVGIFAAEFDLGIPEEEVDYIARILVSDLARYKGKASSNNESTRTGASHRESADFDKMPTAVLSVCATGEGVGKIAESIAENILLANGMGKTELFSLSIESIANRSPEYTKIIEKYNVVAVIGSIDPELNAPFISIRKILTPAGQEDFLRAIKSPALGKIGDDSVKTLAMNAEALLSDHILYLNVKRALVYISAFLDNIAANGLHMSNDIALKLMLHTCCMLERNVQRHCVPFDNKDAFIKNNKRIYDAIKKSTAVLDERFRTQISDDEVCYMVVVANGGKHYDGIE